MELGMGPLRQGQGGGCSWLQEGNWVGAGDAMGDGGEDLGKQDRGCVPSSFHRPPPAPRVQLLGQLTGELTVGQSEK